MSQSCRHVGRALALVAALSLRGAAPALADPPPACVGDCQGTGTVAISSLIALVRIVLGDAPPSSCALGIPSGASVDVALGVRAVHNALSGCSPPQPTATSTAARASTLTPTPTSIPTGSRACPAGQHKSCHGGSGRGGGYKTTCSCVSDPPPVCVTAWGTGIPAGTSVTLYDTNLVRAPDTCAAHAIVVSCDASGILAPAGAVGYPMCSVVSDEGD